MPNCSACSQAFDVTPDDRAFLQKLSPSIGGKTFELPPPTLCIDCREQRRLAVANQLHLYKRTCDLTGELVVSNIPQDSQHKAYKQDIWFSDKWDPFTYGRDFDFQRPFFEQFHELSLAVPRPALFTGYQYDENSEYTNHSGKNKDCYMIFDSDENRDCLYSYSLNGSQSCVDCFRVRKSELCYGCIDALQCYNSAFLQDCENCSDSMFLKNCIGCRNCLMCSNLRNKEYHVENKPISKEQFEKLRAMLASSSAAAGAAKRFEALALEYPQKYMHGTHNENVRGDYLFHCKNADYCFDSTGLWDCRSVFQAFLPLKDCMDIQECGDGERLYECAFVGYGAQNVLCSMHILGDSSDLLYCCYCPHSKNLFGCIGLRHKQYCIFNTQYTKAEYEKLVPEIIEHMINTKEYGEFFPIADSYAAYNETLAQEYYPLTKDEAVARGFRWRDADPAAAVPATYALPDKLDDVPDTVTHEMLACEECGRNERIISRQLALHRQMRLPLPRRCFVCRLRATMQKRNPRKLWKRPCMKCKTEVETAYEPSRPEIVYCERCYLETVN